MTRATLILDAPVVVSSALAAALLLAGCSGGGSSTGGSATGTGGATAATGSSGGSTGGGTLGGTTGGGTGAETSATAGGTSGGTGGTGGTGGGDGASCDPLPAPPPGAVMATPDDAANLQSMVAALPSGATLLLASGTYDLSGGRDLVVTQDGITVRSASGNPADVILDLGYSSVQGFLVSGDDFTVAELTIRRAGAHGVHVVGGTDSNTENPRIYRVRVEDPGQQGIKVNPSAEDFFVDYGEIACSEIVLTDVGRGQVSDCYTGGIDAHAALDWVVRDNTIEGFWCPEGLSEHAIHFWNVSRGTLVERNRIVDCARGVGFGLGTGGNGTTRDYGDDPCPGASYLGHIDGLIRNNLIWAGRPELFASQAGMDSGVAVEQACGAQVVHNTVYAAGGTPFVSMEYRFPNTDATFANNLVSHTIVARDQAMASLEGNLEGAGPEHFVDAATGDLHLVPGSTAVDAGAAIADPPQEDADGQPRDDGQPDVGGDELDP